MAAWWDHLPVCEFFLSRPVEATNDGGTALSHYWCNANPVISPETKALRCAALEAAHADFLRSALRSIIEVPRTQGI